MTMDPQPLRSLLPPPHPHSGEESGPHKKVGEGKKNFVTEGSKSNKVGEENLPIKYGKAVLTPGQLIEFQQQAFIFKHMKAGLPVPLHLVIPIWKSVAGSFGSDIGGIYKQYPSFAGFCPQEFDHRNMIDPEPGRCRRTDGKKWRCSKNVVPDQKYCERHMHRGRQRSRKLVEASQIASSSSDTISAKDSDNLKAILTHTQSDPHSQSPLPFLPPRDSKDSQTISTIFQLTTHSSSNTGSIVTTVSSCSKDDAANGLHSGINNRNSIVRGSMDSVIPIAISASTTPETSISIASFSPVNTCSPTVVSNTTNESDNDVCGTKTTASTVPIINNTVAATTPNPAGNPVTGTGLTTAASITTFNKNKSNHSPGWKCDGSNSTNMTRMINRSGKSGNKSGNSYNSNVSAGLGFSPKSVLQVRGSGGSYFYRSEIELEAGRCRRTDGKKWRCSRDVIPDQKYCMRHMHRGAKKRVEASLAVANLTTVASSVCLPPMTTTPKEADSAILDINLSISIPASPQLMTNDAKSPTSSSDATISDTTITAYESNNFCT